MYSSKVTSLLFQTLCLKSSGPDYGRELCREVLARGYSEVLSETLRDVIFNSGARPSCDTYLSTEEYLRVAFACALEYSQKHCFGAEVLHFT